MRIPICDWCGNVDVDDDRCPCPHDEVTARVRAALAEQRHRQAVAAARRSERYRRVS
jgi:hypothetical protein